MGQRIRDLDGNYVDVPTVADAGLQTVRLIGPFRVNFDDPEIADNTGLVLTSIPGGSLVVRAWAIIRSVWTYTGGPGEDMLLNLELDAGVGGSFYNAQIDSNFGTEYPDEDGIGIEPFSTTASFLAVAQAAAGGSEIRASVITPDVMTAGSVDVYALIAESA